jgi:hypothetical protein
MEQEGDAKHHQGSSEMAQRQSSWASRSLYEKDGESEEICKLFEG